MAPHRAFAGTMLHLAARKLGDKGNAPQVTPSQGNILQCLALSFATISVASALLAFYWFIQMRRTFRHDLIMLLIQSDMFKALWFMVYPIVTFIHGPVSSSSKFCQVNGFFLSVGIEASDIAILMIALHTALYIFKARDSNGEGGLYPYRWIAYTCWFVIPIIMGSLAFINEDLGYVAEGTYCYLPVRPFWYRLALSWVPRYAIFLTILGVYASIYFYVRYKFKGFSRNHNRNRHNNDSAVMRHPRRQHSVPSAATLTPHGLLPDSGFEVVANGESRKQSASTLDPYYKMRIGAHRFMWTSFMSKALEPSVAPSEPSIVDTDSLAGPSTPQPLPEYVDSLPISSRQESSLTPVTPSRSRITSWRDSFVHRISLSRTQNSQSSIIDIRSALRHPDSMPSTPLSQLHLFNSRGEDFADLEMIRSREKISRQLRFLFIYPLVYIGMWALPFVSHVIQYDDRLAFRPPFALDCITTISICLQGAVDCWLFSTREKPWKSIPNTDGSLLNSVKFWSGWRGVNRRSSVSGPGRTREEMVREARAAYRRRDEELAQRRSEITSVATASDAINIRRERSWWDGLGLDGPPGGGLQMMSPVAEERSVNFEELYTSPSPFDDDNALPSSPGIPHSPRS